MRSLPYLLGIRSHSPFYTRLYKPSISYALNGGFKVAISNATHPNDHISDFVSYGSSLQTSGDA